MTVSRDIKITFLSNDWFSDFIIQFCHYEFSLFDDKNKIQTINADDIEDFNFIDLENTNEFKKILDIRSNKGLPLTFILYEKKLNERIVVNVYSRKDETYFRYRNKYEMHLGLGFGKRLVSEERFTDFSYYLEEIIFNITRLGGSICEITCNDFDC